MSEGKFLIQTLLVIGVIVIAVVLLRSQGARHMAVRRILLGLFAVVAVLSIWFRNIWTEVAHFLGVDRGADLLLYCLLIAFFSYVATRYSRDRRTQRQLTALARRIALDEAGPAQPGEPVPPASAAPSEGE